MFIATQYRLFWFVFSKYIYNDTPPLSALDSIVGQFPEGKLRQGMRDIAAEMHGGKSFSEAMENSGLFCPSEVALIRAAEALGMLESAVKIIATNKLQSRVNMYEDLYQTLGVLIGHGVPMLRALQICLEKLDPPLKAAVEKIIEDVKEGYCICSAMKASGEFSDGEVFLVDIGEQTGALDQALLQLAKICRQSFSE